MRAFPWGRLLAIAPSHSRHQPPQDSIPSQTPGTRGCLQRTILSAQESRAPPRRRRPRGVFQGCRSAETLWEGAATRGCSDGERASPPPAPATAGSTNPDPSLIHTGAPMAPEPPHPAVYFCHFPRNLISDV